MKTLSLFMPLTHAVAISRAIFLGDYTRGLVFNFLVIFVLETVAFLIGVRLMKKRLIK
jgi:ABC-type polysaccharide/polyol phosphate export permease